MELIVAYGLWVHPLVLPTALGWGVVAASGWRLLRARRARTGRPGPSVWSLLFWIALGCLVAVTLTPSRIGLGLDLDTHEPVWCHLELPRTTFGLLARNPERRWNVLIAVPLGVAAAGWLGSVLLLRTRVGREGPMWAAWFAVPAALAAPAGVELVQAQARRLGRVCAVVDAVDNLSGVVLGLVAGALFVASVRGLRAARRRHACAGDLAWPTIPGPDGRP